MREIASTLTLRLYTDEAAQLEILKELTGKSTGSEAIKNVIREYPRFCIHYKKQTEDWKAKEKKYREQEQKLQEVREAIEVLLKFVGK